MPARCNGWTAAAEAQQLTAAALLEALIDPILVHLRAGKKVIEVVGERIAYLAFHPPAGVAGTIAENGEMRIATVAAIIDDVVVRVVGWMEKSMLIQEQCPEMVFQAEIGVGVFV